ncbi:MAG TPA: hypothetical protein VK590_13775 [Saprospiraceae bacterium]|nr:hypothetical protein [Saprospiraceae bacterium]
MKNKAISYHDVLLRNGFTEQTGSLVYLKEYHYNSVKLELITHDFICQKLVCIYENPVRA